MDNISKVLEINFLEYTKNDRAFVSDSNIKNFLIKNDWKRGLEEGFYRRINSTSMICWI